MEKVTTIATNMPTSLLLGAIFLAFFVRVFEASVLRPRRLRSRIVKQGIKGPAPSLLFGNIPEIKRIAQFQKPMRNFLPGKMVHDWFPAVFPHLEQWRNEYGPTFVYSTGTIQIICITDAEMVKEMSLHTSLNLGKPSYLSTERGPLLGRGILSSNGAYWAHQRKIIAPEFYLGRVKDMVSLMAESTSKMLKTWEKKIGDSDGEVEITVDDDFRCLSADIISRACFGRSYELGEEIFGKLQSLQRIMSKGSIGVPGMRHLPTKHNRELWSLEREVDSMILDAVKNRRGDDDNEKEMQPRVKPRVMDLLQLLLNAAESEGDESNIPSDLTPNKFIVDNCKNIYFAGHETTAISASWCLMMLSAHPDWQARAREEVLEICGGNTPTSDILRSMKVLNMVIQETLRLYPPVAYVVREALQDIDFKGLCIPRGANMQVPIPVLHRHSDLWGPDAHEFKPERFGNGVLGACKVPQAYMPFGFGTRTCAGQHFAMAELKVIMSLILSKFRWYLSPACHHSPVFRLLIQPNHGVCVLLQKL